MTVKCREASLRMSESLDDRLAHEEREELDRHLETCPTCRARWQAMQSVSSILRGRGVALPPAGFTYRVMARLHEAEERRRSQAQARLVRLGWIGALATVLLSIVLVLIRPDAAAQQSASLGLSIDLVDAALGLSQLATGMTVIMDIGVRTARTVLRLLPDQAVWLGLLWAAASAAGLTYTLATIVGAYRPLAQAPMQGA